MPESIKGLLKTHSCGELTSANIGESVTLCGWVNKYRDLGALHFIDIRDKFGVTQLGFEKFSGDISILKNASLESAILAKGKVQARPDSAKNKDMLTGEIEVQVEEFQVLSQSDKDNIPFLPHGLIDAKEDLRLKYRYLDLRTEKLQKMLTLRSDASRKVRNYLADNGFTEVETPVLYKSTPEGARDYIVPSRVHPGEVYALPQSPQTLKQLLMIGNTDKYYQIVKCFRDEDLRADRQPEFTQIDIEVSFATQEYIKNLATGLVQELFGYDSAFEVPVMSYDEAMETYGSDKPDLRFGLKHINATSVFADSGFSIFVNTAKENGLIKAIFVPESIGTFARKQIDALTEVVKPYGGKGVAWFKNTSEGLSGGISKFITDEILSKLESLSDEKGHGTWFFCADVNHDTAHSCADAVRRHFGKELSLIDKEKYAFVWIKDFPLLEWDDDGKRYVARHHPFTMPKIDELEAFMNSDPTDANGPLRNMKAEAYDLVCNGYEMGGGSVRIYQQNVQEKMFQVLGMTEEEALYQFGFFIEALKYGTPPHAGIAFGFDRTIMLLAKNDNIRDVIAFPKTNSATDLMAGSPSRPADAQTKELHFNWIKK